MAHVIGVAERDIAFASPDRANLCAVVAFGFAGKVCFDTFGPSARVFFTVMGDDSRQKGEVVVVHARTGADTACPFRIGEVFVGGHFTICHALLARIDDTGAGGEREPEVIRAAQFGRDRRG